MLSGLMNFFKVCFRPRSESYSSDAGGRQDGLLWYKDSGQHITGDFSMAVVQANNLLEDQSQLESGCLSVDESGPYGTFVGVYDGHGGPETSRFINVQLFQHLKKFTSEHQSMSEEVIRKAFNATEEGFTSIVRKQWPVKPQLAAVGSCCLVGVICNGNLYVATQTQHFPLKFPPISPNSTPIHNTYFTITRHFSSNRSDDSEDYDDDDEMGESLDEDDVVSGFSGKREYTKEEKESEANAIGYKVVGPLERSDRVFKDYEPVFAVIQIGSHQFKVSNGDCVYTEKLKFCEVHDKIILNKVLVLGSPTQTLIGRPVLPDATVHAVVEEHALDAKVIIFKKKRRKNYRRTKGHRQGDGTWNLNI